METIEVLEDGKLKSKVVNGIGIAQIKEKSSHKHSGHSNSHQHSTAHVSPGSKRSVPKVVNNHSMTAKNGIPGSAKTGIPSSAKTGIPGSAKTRDSSRLRFSAKNKPTTGSMDSLYQRTGTKI